VLDVCATSLPNVMPYEGAADPGADRWFTDGGISAMEPSLVRLAARSQSVGRTSILLHPPADLAGAAPGPPIPPRGGKGLDES
jgi:hypothetical protein